jgi:hypothetical protein
VKKSLCDSPPLELATTHTHTKREKKKKRNMVVIAAVEKRK